MAVTKIWAIKDSIYRVINYARNPQKTNFTELKQVLNYAKNDEKTFNKSEKTMYVTGVNCNRETAYEEMKKVQERFDKCTGNVAYHAYQSFKTGEVTPQLAHKIGVELANKMFPEHQVLVATHFNTGTYHNHFVINAVNMVTGKKFNCNKGAYYRFRELSDKLCEENNLVVIKNPKGRTPRNIYFAEKRGEPTKYNVMRKAIEESMEMCISYGQFKKIMLKKGYIIKDDYNRKYPTIQSIYDKKPVRMYHLGEQYLPQNISKKVNENPYYFQNRYLKFTSSKKRRKRSNIYKFKGKYKNIKKLNTLDILFIALYHFIGLLPKEKPYHKPLSPEMKQEVRKMERYANETNFIVTEEIKTVDDINSYITLTEKEIKKVTDLRQKYRNKLRHCKDNKLINEYTIKRNECTSVLNKYRKNIRIANYILEDIPKVKKVINIEKQMIQEQEGVNRTKKKIRNER